MIVLSFNRGLWVQVVSHRVRGVCNFGAFQKPVLGPLVIIISSSWRRIPVECGLRVKNRYERVERLPLLCSIRTRGIECDPRLEEIFT